MLYCLALLLALFSSIYPTALNPAPNTAVEVSLVRDGEPGPATRHGWKKIEDALSAQGIHYEEVTGAKDARGSVLIAAGPSTGSGLVAGRIQTLGIKIADKPESLLIHKTEWRGKQMLLLSGSDDRGMMYALLEVANRLGWAKDRNRPLSEVRDTVESPFVADRGITIFTMQKHQFEDRLHDENYWAEYFDMMAEDRLNNIQVLFAYETNGYMCPAYPFFMDVDGFPDVKITGLSKEDQQRNLADLHRLVRMAHDRGIRVTLGLWCHYYRYTPSFGIIDHSKPIPGTVENLTEDNLIPYTRAALGKFLREFHEVDGIQLAMQNETGLKTGDMKDFWESMYGVMKASAPNMQYELRAKGVPNDLIQHGINLGLKIRFNTKYWAEEVGLPFHPTHIQALNQYERRHGYADMFKYPQTYQLHWTLWTSGTTRILLWGDPEYVRRFAATTHLGGAQGFEVMEPLATKMAGYPHDMKPFDLLSPSYRYYDYEFQRYWHFYQVFGRLSYNPNTPSEEWDRQFVARFGTNAAPYVEQGVHRASQILPHIVAYCLPAALFSTTRGWPERQREGDLSEYAAATPSDTEQFEGLQDAADDMLQGRSSPKVTPMETSKWFARASSDVRQLVAQAEQHAGPHPGKEFVSTIIDLKILSDLAAYHSRRIPAGLGLALFEKTHDLNALDDAILHEQEATEAWADIVRDAGDAYNFDLKLGLPEYDLSGHWRDELVKLQNGLAALKKQRAEYHLEARRVLGKYALGNEPLQPGYQRYVLGRGALNETAGNNVVALNAPDGRYEVTVGIHDDKASHGPMWIEVNGVEYSDEFTVPAGQNVQRTTETSAVDGRLKVIFDNSTSTNWHANTVVVTRIDPAIAHIPVRRLAPGQNLILRATVAGIAPIAAVRAYYGDMRRGFTMTELHGAGPLYQGTIPASKFPGGTSYFLEATDNAGRMSTFPEEGSMQPIQVMVTGDNLPPAFEHTPIVTAQALHALHIVARVKDPSGIKWVHLRYRGLSQHQDFHVLNMLPTGNVDEYEATVPGMDIDPHFDFMYLFEVMDNAGNGRIYPDLAKETPYIIVKVDHSSVESSSSDSGTSVNVAPTPGMQR